MKKPLGFICRQKINFILHVFFVILQTCWLGYFQHAWLRTPSDIIILLEIFIFICRQKINFIPHALPKILQKYANFLFCVLWACLVTHTQNNTNLQNTSMFICKPKINFKRYEGIINFFIWEKLFCSQDI